MPTYYETLGVKPTATEQEIIGAFDQQYNYWRRLVNHSDPKYARQAKEAIQLLETIRTTLTDPDRRSAYDASIGRGEVQGGLDDPEALYQSTTPAGQTLLPPKPVKPDAAPARTRSRKMLVDAWVCPACSEPNQQGHQFCQHCGHELSQECPKCKKMFEKRVNFCPACEKDQQAFLRRKEQERLEEQQKLREQEVQAIQIRRQAIEERLMQTEAYLRSYRYRLAQETLTGSYRLTSVESSTWPEAEVLEEQSKMLRQKADELQKQINIMRKRAIWKVAPFTAVIGVIIGIVAPYVLLNLQIIVHIPGNEWLVAVVLVSVAIGIAWPIFYFYEFGGRRNSYLDYVTAYITSVVLSSLTPVFIAIAVILFIIVIICGVLAILGGA